MYRSRRGEGGGGGLGPAGIDQCIIHTGFTSSMQDFSPRNKLNTSILTLQWSVLLPCIRQQIKGEQSDEIRHSSFISRKPLEASKSHLCPLVRLVCIISSFYKAFEQFSSRSIELILKLSFSRRKSLLIFLFFSGALFLKLVNSFNLVLIDTQIMNCLPRHERLSLF